MNDQELRATLRHFFALEKARRKIGRELHEVRLVLMAEAAKNGGKLPKLTEGE